MRADVDEDDILSESYTREAKRSGTEKVLQHARNTRSAGASRKGVVVKMKMTMEIMKAKRMMTKMNQLCSISLIYLKIKNSNDFYGR